MSVILIGGEKGGTGKTTTATNIVIMKSMMGRDAYLIDTVKQASSYKFLSHRRERNLLPTPHHIQLFGKYLHREIEDFSVRCEDIVIDSGGYDSVELRSAMSCKAVSKFYSPFKPSEFDLETLGKIDELVYTARSFNPELQAYVYFNQAPTHSQISLVKEAIEVAKKFENVIVIENPIIGHRINFQYAASSSQSVIEFEEERYEAMPAWQRNKFSPKASLEIIELYNHIYPDAPFENSNFLTLKQGDFTNESI